MKLFKPHGLLDDTYTVSIILKGLDGILEIAGAVLLLFVSPHAINSLVTFLTQRELSEDPHDVIASYLLHSGQHLANGGSTYGVIYLLSHGFIKVVVVGGLLANKKWAYPFSLVTLSLFVLYQIYEIGYHHSISFILLTIFDLFVIYLVWREYRKQVLIPEQNQTK